MPRNALTITIEEATADLLELLVAVDWQSWSALDRVHASRADLTAFASALRELAAHDRPEVRFATGGLDKGLLEITVSEYGRARKAALGFHLGHSGEAHGSLDWPSELTVQLPTEHGLLGEFAADLAQLLAADSGVATLRLLRRWPE